MERIVFLGQKPIGERCFRELLDRGKPELRVVGAVSNAATSTWWGSNAIRTAAKDADIPFVDNSSRHEDVIGDLIRREEATAIISVQHPWVVSAQVLAAVRHRAWNVHNARLPEYMGYNAVNHALLNGEDSYTSTVHWMAEEVDTGELAFTETFELTGTETARCLYARAAEAGQEAFSRLLDVLESGADVPREVAEGQPRFYSRDSIDPLRRIENINDGAEIDRKARAFWFPPFEPAFLELDGRRFYVVPQDGFRDAD